tara:strand:+ start:2275 stop:2757 length:483 start_codon:yes stop_codon:yes gene_type:complete
MAYVHSKYEVAMVPVVEGNASLGGLGSATSAGAAGSAVVTTLMAAWGPGYVPHIIRGAALVMTGSDAGAFTGAAVVCSFNADISTPGTATQLFQIALPSSGNTNKAVYYTPTYQIEVPPGAEVQLIATTAATAGIRARAMLYVEPRWEEAENVTTMQLTT